MQPLWSFSLQAGPAGLALAREKGSILAWDRAGWLYLLDPRGRCEAQRQFTDGLKSACCSDDGSARAAVSTSGKAVWLGPDLATRWEQELPHPALAAALDPFGQYLAVAGDHGSLTILDHQGKSVAAAESSRPLHHVTFVPAAPVVLGAADYGLVAAFDLVGKLIWRAGVVAHVGTLAVSGDGDQIILACFSEGLQRYNLAGERLERVSAPASCGVAAVSFDGKRILAGGLDGKLFVLDTTGQVLASQQLDKPAAALALGALAKDAVVALPDGRILRLTL